MRLRGRHLLDQEALACLLVMLFVDEPRLQTARLHRVLRNLCYHAPTRAWIVRSLLSILHRTAECKPGAAEPATAAAATDAGGSGVARISDKLKRKGNTVYSQSSAPSLNIDVASTSRAGADLRLSQPSWLSISLDAALGCRTNVFQLQQRGHAGGGGGKKSTPNNTYVCIHPQASLVVCKHVLDALISLAKSFPSHFLPQNKAQEVQPCSDAEGREPKTSNTTLESRLSSHASHASSSRTSAASKIDSKAGDKPVAAAEGSEFWDLLVRLDTQSATKKGKAVQRLNSAQTLTDDAQVLTYDSSPIGQLMSMLAHPVVKRSQVLTDKLLRLLGLVSAGLQDASKTAGHSAATSTAVTSAVTSAATSATGASLNLCLLRCCYSCRRMVLKSHHVRHKLHSMICSCSHTAAAFLTAVT